MELYPFINTEKLVWPTELKNSSLLQQLQLHVPFVGSTQCRSGTTRVAETQVRISLNLWMRKRKQEIIKSIFSWWSVFCWLWQKNIFLPLSFANNFQLLLALIGFFVVWLMFFHLTLFSGRIHCALVTNLGTRVNHSMALRPKHNCMNLHQSVIGWDSEKEKKTSSACFYGN